MNRLHSIQNFLKNLNIFNKETDDENLRRNGIISTRIYFILLAIILFSFTLYISLLDQPTLIIIPTPSLSQYEQLDIFDDLQCPCTQITTPYEDFVTIDPSYYEICSSDFVSQQWIDYLFYENTSYYYQFDYRRSASSQFQILRTLCQLAQQTVNDTLEEFYLNQYITIQVTPRQTFDIEINSSIQLFQLTTPPLFQNTLKLIRETFINNELFSAIDLLNNIQYEHLPVPYVSMFQINYYETQLEHQNFGCYCSNTVECKLPEGIYNLTEYVYAGSDWMGIVNATTNMINATILLPGMFAGCSSIESLMKSTSQCLFNQSCLNIIISSLHNASQSSSVFNNLNESQFAPETSFEIISNELFVEDWNYYQSYEKYYNQCQPLYCQYTKQQKYNVLHILTATISLYGGLRILLQFFIPILVKFIRNKQWKLNADENVTSPIGSMLIRLRLLCRYIINSSLQLNNYDSNSTDEYTQQTEIISTRMHYLVVIISLVVLMLFTLIRGQIKVVTINNPTQVQFEQLQKDFADSLQCPCSQISIKCEKFILFQPIYHQICSSGFVSDLWYQADYWQNFQEESSVDFRYVAPFMFTLLSTLCQSANQTIIDSLTLFYSYEYLTPQVVSSDLFNNEVISFIELFETQTQQSFMQTLNLIRRITFGNQLISSSQSNTNIKTYFFTNIIEAYSAVFSFYNCSCSDDPTCKEELIFGDYKEYTNIEGFYLACFPFDSLLLSTTACFYKDACVNQMKSYMNPNHTLYELVQVLNISEMSSYEHDSLLETIVNNLFIENWNVSYFYDKYYNQCKPNYCLYTINEHLNFLYLLAKIFGIYGGLSALIKYIIPSIVKFIRRKKRRNNNNNDDDSSIITRICVKIRGLFPSIKEKIIQLNLFDRHSTDIFVIQRQRIATRLYIITLIIVLIILLLYTSFNKQSKSITIKSVTQTDYEKLYRKYPNTLNCPCNQIAIKYQTFIELQPTYHNICTSDFVSQRWIQYLYDILPLSPPNLRVVSSVQFHTLSLLCQSTGETVNDSLTQFYGTKFINIQLVPPDLFQTQIQSAIQNFKVSAPRTFKRTLDMIRGLIQGNAFMSIYETNWKFTLINAKHYASVYTNPRSYGNSCSCGTSSLCLEAATINNDLNLTLPGLFVGCYPVESILQSTLECLYEQSCVNLIMSMIEEQPSSITFKALDSSLFSANSSYSINETIEQMVNRLFVNDWNINSSYTNYFKQCQPSYCTYSYIEYFDAVYIVATILGLFGGLIIGIKILAIVIVRIIMHILKRRGRNVIASSESPENFNL